MAGSMAIGGLIVSEMDAATPLVAAFFLEAGEVDVPDDGTVFTQWEIELGLNGRFIGVGELTRPLIRRLVYNEVRSFYAVEPEDEDVVFTLCRLQNLCWLYSRLPDEMTTVGRVLPGLAEAAAA